MGGGGSGEGLADDGGELGQQGPVNRGNLGEGCDQGGRAGGWRRGGQGLECGSMDYEASSSINQEVVGRQEINPEYGLVNRSKEEGPFKTAVAESQSDGAATPGGDKTTVGTDKTGARGRGFRKMREDTTGGASINQKPATGQAVDQVEEGDAGGDGV